MLTKQEISRAVKTTASTLDEIAIFSSTTFKEMMQGAISACTYDLKRTPDLHTKCDIFDDTTAFTNGKTVHLNTMGPLIRELPTTWEKYLSNFGHVTHEVGHVLFTDFTNSNPRRKAWAEKTFSFYPNKPAINGIDVDEFIDYLNRHPNYRNIFVKCMCDLDNIMEDVYIENRLYEKFNGLCSAGLHKVNDEEYRLSTPINDYLDAVLNGMTIPLAAALPYIHLTQMGYEPKRTAFTSEQQELFDFIEQVLQEANSRLEQLCYETSGSKRSDLLNELFVILAPLFPRPENDEDLPQQGDPGEGEESNEEGEGDNSSDNEGNGNSNQNSSNSSGNNQKSSENSSQSQQNGSNTSESSQGNTQSQPSAKDISNQLEQLENQLSQAPKGNTKPVDENPVDKDEVKRQKEKANNLSNSQNSVESLLNTLKQEIAKEILEAEAESDHTSELQREGQQIANQKNKQTNNQYFSGFQIRRLSKNRATCDKALYDSIYKEVAYTAQSLSRKIKNIWKDREFDSVESGYIFGQRFNAKDVFRNDGRYFSRINEPDGKLRVCFGVLVDESGSMYGENSELARKTAIMFDDILRNINVPHIIVGHTTSNEGVALNSYCDFDTVDDSDKYRLCDISAYNCNVDGAAITYMSEKLLKRPEEIKVLIVISDGTPTGSSFYSTNSENDTKIAIKSYRKKGVKIFGAVVDTWNSVSELYGNEYAFDCREKGALEAQFLRLIKKYCINLY